MEMPGQCKRCYKGSSCAAIGKWVATAAVCMSVASLHVFCYVPYKTAWGRLFSAVVYILTYLLLAQHGLAQVEHVAQACWQHSNSRCVRNDVFAWWRLKACCIAAACAVCKAVMHHFASMHSIFDALRFQCLRSQLMSSVRAQHVMLPWTVILQHVAPAFKHQVHGQHVQVGLRIM
jgi:hypothetical protein